MDKNKSCPRRVIYQGKSDMKSAFRNLPLAVTEFCLTAMKAVNPQNNKTYFFVDKCLPFGASISCSLFQEFSDAVAFIFTRKTGEQTVNYLDDYYFCALLKSLCDVQIQKFLNICESIKFPVSLEKTYWGTTMITFLGFLIDTVRQLVSIPVDKVTRAIDLIFVMLNRKSGKTTLHKLQKLCGFLNHLCHCVVPGRAFTRRLYAYTSGALLPHHHININREMKSDLTTWLSFLKNPAIYSRPFADFTDEITAEDMYWYTDASRNPRLGYGGIFDTNYFYNSWSENRTLDDNNFIIKYQPSIEFLELNAVTVSIQLWIHKVSNRAICLYCDNDSVVKMLKKSSSSCKKCMILIRRITLLSLEHNVKISAKHVRSRNNAISDVLSRFQFRRFRHELKRQHREVNQYPDNIPSELLPIEKIWLDF